MPGAGDKNDENNQNPGGGGDENNQNQNQNPGGGGEGGDKGGFTDIAAANAEILKLRKEAAGYRTKSKDLESKLSGQSEDLKVIKEKLGIKDEQEDPKKVIEGLTAKIAQMEAEAEFRETARSLGVPPEHEELFATLINQKAAKLNDGEELSDDQVQEVVQTINKLALVNQSGTGVPAPKGTQKNDGGKTDEVTPEAFAKMSLSQKNELYLKNPEAYQAAFAGAKEKRLLR